MKTEDKELLLKDLSARLPYKVVVNATSPHYNINGILTDVYYGLDSYIRVANGMQYHIDRVKPYLLPMSSMTVEQEMEFDRVIELEIKVANNEIDQTKITEFVVDFYHKHHLDWRGLIPKGLAKDATNLNIYGKRNN